MSDAAFAPSGETRVDPGRGPWGAIAVNVANMIGTGVFLKTRVMTCNVGSAKMVLLVWVAAGLLSLAGSFSYSEIAAMMPEAGGDYVYLRRAYGRAVGFLYGWMTFAVAKAGSQAALAVGLAIFMNVALGGRVGTLADRCGLVRLSRRRQRADGGGASTIWTVALINCASVTAGGRTALGLTIAKVALDPRRRRRCLYFRAGRLVAFERLRLGRELPRRGGQRARRVRRLRRRDAGGAVGLRWMEQRGAAYRAKSAIRSAIYRAPSSEGCSWSRPCTCSSMSPITTPCRRSKLPACRTASSVATEVLKRYLGPIAVSMTAVALMVSSFGSLHASVLANSRVPFAMARDGLFFRALAHLSPRSNVPARAIVAQAAWGSILALSGSYDSLTDSVIFASWLFYGLSTGSLFIFRRTMPDAHRPYRALGYPLVPIIFLLVTAGLLINTFVAAPNEALKGVVVLLAGLPLYWYWSRKNPPASET